MAWFSLFSLLWLVFFRVACLSRTLWKSRKKALKLKTVSIFSVARAFYCTKVSFKDIHIEILEICEHSLTVIFGDAIFLKVFKDNKLWEMISSETCYVTRDIFIRIVIHEYIINECCWFLSHSSRDGYQFLRIDLLPFSVCI